MKRELYYRGRPGHKWGIWNTVKHCWQFGICEDTPMLAEARLFQKIGDDAKKYRFEPRILPAKFAAVFSCLRDLPVQRGTPIWWVLQDDPYFYPETNGWNISRHEIAEVCTTGFWPDEGPDSGGDMFDWSFIGEEVFLTEEEAQKALEQKVASGESNYK